MNSLKFPVGMLREQREGSCCDDAKSILVTSLLLAVQCRSFGHKSFKADTTACPHDFQQLQ